MISEIRNHQEFDSIDLRGIGAIHFTMGAEFGVSVTADEALLPLVQTDVVDNVLVIDIEKGHASNWGKQEIRYDITMPLLKHLQISGAGKFLTERLDGNAIRVDISGSGKIDINDLAVTGCTLEITGSGKVAFKRLETQSLALTITGSGQVDIVHIDAQAITSEITGSGKVTLAGKTHVQTLRSPGVSNYQAEHLKSAVATIETTGVGNITVAVDEQLTALVGGMAKVAYYGQPNVNKSVRGLANLKALGAVPMVTT